MIREVDRVVEELKENRLSHFGLYSRFKIKFRDDVFHVWDFSLYDGEQILGYTTVNHDNNGTYYLGNNFHGYDHEGMPDLFGAGVEVHPMHRNRNIGHALLGIGILYAAQDFLKNEYKKEFAVCVYGLGRREAFFKKFGFETEHKNLGGQKPHINGKYTKLHVPDIKISV